MRVQCIINQEVENVTHCPECDVITEYKIGDNFGKCLYCGTVFDVAPYTVNVSFDITSGVMTIT